MWQRFTERARRVILLGQQEAERMNSGHVGTEHLLLGLARENEGVAAQVLQKMGVSLGKVCAEVEAESPPGTEPIYPSEPKLTRKAKRVLELAADEARQMRHNYVGSEHLLLALLREKDGIAARVLMRLGLDLERARAEVLEYLGPDAPSISEPTRAPLGTENPLAEPTPVGELAESFIERHRPRMWNRLDEGTRRVLLLSLAEAKARRCAQVASEHLLLGLLGEREGEVAQILGAMGISKARVREEIRARVPLGTDKVEGQPTLAPHAIPILQSAATQATREGSERIGTRHLLIALLQHGGTAALVLQRVRAQARQLSAQIDDLLEAEPRAQNGEAAQNVLGDADFDPFEKTLDLAPSMLRALELATQEARQMGHLLLTPEHVLLALLREPGTLASALLLEAKLDLPTLRAQVEQYFGSENPEV